MQKFVFSGFLTLSLFAPLRWAQASDGTFNDTTPNNTTQYTLGAGNSGTVTSSGSLTYNGDNDTIEVDNTSGGTSPISISNAGTINNTNTNTKQNGRDIQLDGSNVTLDINNTGTMETANADVIQANVSSGTQSATLTIENSGTINAENTPETASALFNKGQQAIDLNHLTAGSVTITNYGGGAIEALESDTIQLPLGGTSKLYNYGLIQSTRASGSTSSVDAINAETATGTVIDNDFGLTGQSPNTPATSTTVAVSGQSSIIGAHHGIAGNGTAATSSSLYTMTINNGANGVIQGNDGSGVNIDGVNGYETVTISNSGTISGNGVTGDGDGVDVDGDVAITNLGSITSLNAVPKAGSPAGAIEFSEGVTVGGGSIINGSNLNSTATIEGEVAAGNTHGVGRGITLAGVDQDANDVSMPIQSIYENSSITNSGTIKGDSESGIAVLGTTGGGHSVTITNNATGSIVGNNTGTSERANVTYNGVTSPNGQSLNQGAIELDDTSNTYEVDNSGTITQGGTSGVAVAMHSSSSNVLNVYGGAINGDVAGDTAGDSNLTFDVGASSTGSFSFSHNISNFAVNVKSGSVQFSGTIGNTGATTVSGGQLDISGSMLNSTTTVQSGGRLLGDGMASAVTIRSGGIAQAGDSATGLASTQAGSTNSKFSLAGLTVDGGSTLAFDLDHATPGTGTTTNPAGGTMFDLGLSGIFAAGTNVTPGSVLLNFDGSTVGGTAAAPNVYELVAFAPAGTTLTTSDFTVQNLSVDGGGAYGLSFVDLSDGQEALDLTVVPEPGTWTMLLGGLGLLAAVGRWRKLSS